MEQNLQTELMSLLKRNGLTKKYEREVEQMAGVTCKAHYLGHVEALYAISRLFPAVNDDKLRDKLYAANREWVEWLIDKDSVSQLRPYYDRYGTDMVKRAVLYLIDKNAWTSPVADKYIKVKSPENYDGLRDIDETVQFLLSEETTEQTEEPADEPAEVAPGLPIDVEALQATHNLMDARQTFHVASDALQKAVESLETLGKVCLGDELLTMLENENKHLETENQRLTSANKMLQAKVAEHADLRQRIDAQYDAAMDRQEEDFNKQIKTLQDRNTVLAKELDREKKLHQADNDRSFQCSLAREKAEKALSDLQKQYDQTASELDTLRRAAKDAQATPSCRIIPMTELDSLPLMGNKMKSVLIPLLEKHGVKVLTDEELRRSKRK